MKKILSILLVIILLIIVCYYFIKVSKGKVPYSTELSTITMCGKQYYINDVALDDKNIIPLIEKIVNYNYEHDDVKKPTSNPTDNPTEYIKYSVRPFVIASSTCNMLAQSYDGKELVIHDIKNTEQNKSFYVNDIMFYVRTNNTNSILVNLYPDDQSGMEGPSILQIK